MKSVPDCRLDKWLWHVRVFKTRSDATAACRNGSAQVNNQPAKPARDVRPGEIVSVRLGVMSRTLRVVAVPAARVGAKLLPEFVEDLTPPAEYEKLKRPKVELFLARGKGLGRPTKRDRRALARLFGFE
ncbi:MAG: RNA-binding S4 domain-containing protein [Opitutaceae bacterium]|nr:RNA-binding S4 domain-containing protein [Opitutaceae bacterium]